MKHIRIFQLMVVGQLGLNLPVHQHVELAIVFVNGKWNLIYKKNKQIN